MTDTPTFDIPVLGAMTAAQFAEALNDGRAEAAGLVTGTADKFFFVVDDSTVCFRAWLRESRVTVDR